MRTLTFYSVMIYNSLFFLVAFPIVFIVYYFAVSAVSSEKRKNTENICLLVVSYIVLAHESVASCLWLLYVTIVSFFGAIYIERHKVSVLLSVAVTLLPLVILKYTGFVSGILVDMGFSVGRCSLIVPVGISFFTLQAIGYVMDVWSKKIEAERSLLDHSLFVAFFPQIVAGPISRYSELMPQIKSCRRFDSQYAVEGLRMLLWGMFLKVVVADRLALYVDSSIAGMALSDGSSMLFMMLMYSLQIYFDFSGYSLMALGAARLMGFRLPDNFKRPYLALSVTDFWHRWHMSLSRWLRDYVYIPLGGNRKGRRRCYANIVATFFVSGLWHGANYTFVVWGLLHGLLQCVEKLIGLDKSVEGRNIVNAIRWLATFAVVSMLWVIFRMPTVSDAWLVFGKIFSCTSWHLVLPEKYVLVLLLVAIAKDVIDEYCPHYAPLHHRKPIVRWTAYTLVAVAIVLFGVFDSGQFIYAKF